MLQVPSSPIACTSVCDQRAVWQVPSTIDDERAPLLAKVVPDVKNGHAAESPGSLVRQKQALDELRGIWGLVLPTWATHLLEYAAGGSSVVTVGHIGTKELNAASLSVLVINCVCVAPVIIGMSVGLDTLASQAYTSREPRTTSLHVQRTGFLIFCALAPVSVFLFFIEHFFLWIHQDPETAHLASLFIRIHLIGLPFLAGFELLRRWLQAQGLVTVPTTSLLISAPIGIAINFLLVLGPESVRLGFLGAPLAGVISNILNFTFTVCWCLLRAPRKAYGGWSKAIFRDLGPNLKYGLAGAASTCSDWLAWEIACLAMSYFGTTQFAIYQISVTVSGCAWQLPCALMVAAGVRVGNLVGAGSARGAEKAFRFCYMSGLCIGTINAIVLFIARHHVGRIFTTDEEVIKGVSHIVPLLALQQIPDDIRAAAIGSLRGCGKATLAARASVTAYWCFGMPLGFYLAFAKNWQSSGIFVGHVASISAAAIISTWAVSRVNWKEQCEVARKQAEVTAAAVQRAYRDTIDETGNPETEALLECVHDWFCVFTTTLD